jgi:hypothetical protein
MWMCLKNEIMSFARKWMKLDVIILSEISQTQDVFPYMWNFGEKT